MIVKTLFKQGKPLSHFLEYVLKCIDHKLSENVFKYLTVLIKLNFVRYDCFMGIEGLQSFLSVSPFLIFLNILNVYHIESLQEAINQILHYHECTQKTLRLQRVKFLCFDKLFIYFTSTTFRISLHPRELFRLEIL